MNGENRKRETYRTCGREEKKGNGNAFPALSLVLCEITFTPSNVAVMDYRFVVQVVLQMLHARARLSPISLLLVCFTEYKSTDGRTARPSATSIFTNSLSSHQASLLKTRVDSNSSTNSLLSPSSCLRFMDASAIQRFTMLDSTRSKSIR